MTPGWRALLFVVLAATMQLVFAELRLDAQARGTDGALRALGATALTDAERPRPVLRETCGVERGAQARAADGNPTPAAAAQFDRPDARPICAIVDALAPAPPPRR